MRRWASSGSGHRVNVAARCVARRLGAATASWNRDWKGADRASGMQSRVSL